MRFTVSPPIGGNAQTPVVLGLPRQDVRDSVFIGRLAEAGPLRRVELDLAGESVIAIFGKRGSGKSYTLGLIAEALCAVDSPSDIGKTTRSRAALLFDTVNVFWSIETPFDVRADEKAFPAELQQLRAWRISPPQLDVVVWVPAGYRNPYTPERYPTFSIAVAELSDEDICDLFDVDQQRDPMGQLLVEVREKTHLSGEPISFATMLGIVETDDDIAHYYADGTIRAARQRLRSIASSSLFAADGTTLSQFLAPGRLSVLELGDLPNSLRTVVASVLLRRLHSERSRASQAEKQLLLDRKLTEDERKALGEFLSSGTPPTWVLIDEAQNVLPSERAVKSTDAVVRFVREGRNFGLSMVLTTQQPAAVDQRILAQADTVIAHRLTVTQDLAKLRENLKSPEPREVKLGSSVLDASAWVRSLELGHAIITNTEADRVLAVEVRPRVTPHAGSGFQVE